MRLSDFFTLSNKTTGTGADQKSAAADPARTALVNRQIRALTPGQTISGEIVAKNGNEIQIRLSEDMVLNARLEQNMNLELGKGMTFEVKNNGVSLTLTPLFANMATDANVLKALDMAALPVNQTTVDMTQQLMESGLSINKNSLQQVYREISNYTQAQISDIVDLHRLGLPVTQETLNQIASYKNMTYQLTSGMDNILEDLPSVISHLSQSGNPEQAVDLTRVLLELANSLPGQDSLSQSMETQSQTVIQEAPQAPAGNGASVENAASSVNEEPLSSPHNAGEDKTDFSNITDQTLYDLTGKESEIPQAQIKPQLAEQFRALLEGLKLPENIKQQLDVQIANLEAGSGGTGEFLRLAGSLLKYASGNIHEPAFQEKLVTLLQDSQWNGLLTQMVKENWTMSPQDFRDPQHTNELYNRLNRQLHSLANALESVGTSGSNAANSVNNMTQNLDFLQQLNQMYTYVQLPLKMGKDTAHGDLYVYTNKKNMAAKDGSISALLHLDMQNLGPVDVYVALQGTKVNTRFYVKDDNMLDFMAAHMEILNKRLQERGYDMKCDMQLKGKNMPGNPALAAVLQEKTANGPLVQYAFDVRA